MLHPSSLRIYLVLTVILVTVLATGVLADESLSHAILVFDNPVYTNMPVWVHIQFPDGNTMLSANLRYPYSDQPGFFSVHDFEVTLDGQPLPRLKPVHSGDFMFCGNPYGSAAPASSPQGRLPLHLFYSFNKPGTYMVRYKAYDDWGTQDKKLVAESEWTPVEVKPFSPEQRSAWVKDRIAHQPSDVGLVVGDYLPSLLALPDEKVLPVFLKWLHHPDDFVQKYALNALDYYGDDVIKREIPRVIVKEGPTEALAYYLSWHRDLFQPVSGELVDSMIPFLKSNSAKTVGGTLHAFVFMRPNSEWKMPPAVSKRIEAAVWNAVPHILEFNERDAIWPLVLFIGGEKTERAHNLLWELAEIPSVRGQALGLMPSYKDPTDLPKLGRLIVDGDSQADEIPGPMYHWFGADAVPFVLDGVKKSPNPDVVKECVTELVRMNSVDGFRLIKDSLENNRPNKEAVVKGLRNGLDKPQASEADLLKIINEKIASE